MITILLATGVFDSAVVPPPEPSNVTTPAERTINFSRSGSASGPSQTIDPSDTMDFILNLTPLLAEDEQFATITLVVLPESAALGFMVLSNAPYAPEEIDDSHIRIWVTVEEANRSDGKWNKATPCQIQMTATTNSVPARTYQRTCAITVAQR